MSDVPTYHASVIPEGTQPDNKIRPAMAVFIGVTLALVILSILFYTIPIIAEVLGYKSWKTKLPWLYIPAEEYVIKEKVVLSEPKVAPTELSKYKTQRFEYHSHMADGAEIKYDIRVTTVKAADDQITRAKVGNAIRTVMSQHTAYQIYHKPTPIINEIFTLLKNTSVGPGIDVVRYSTFTFQLPRNVLALFEQNREAEMQIMRNKQHLVIIQTEKRVRDAEHDIKMHVKKLEREQLLYQAETKRMVDDILNAGTPPFK